MNANETKYKKDFENAIEMIDWQNTMLRQQAEQIELLKNEGKMLMQLIADMNEEKNKLRHQKSYLIELEQALESSINLNKAQAKRHKRNEQ